jgi:hypothetical protein
VLTVLTLQARENIAVFPTGHVTDAIFETLKEPVPYGSGEIKRLSLTFLPLSETGRDLCIKYTDLEMLTDKWKILESFKLPFPKSVLHSSHYETIKKDQKC